MPDQIRRIGSLPAAFQYVALDMNIGDDTTVDLGGTKHFSTGHGIHEDLYYLRRISKDEVEMTKFHAGSIEINLLSSVDFTRKRFKFPTWWGDPNAIGFRDLFKAAKGREMAESEAKAFFNLPQSEVNAAVKQLAQESRGQIITFDYADHQDDTVYTMFTKSPPGYTREDDNAIATRSKVGSPSAREGYAELLFYPITVGLSRFHRAHGGGTGYVSSGGIQYVPVEANLTIHNSLNDFIQSAYQHKADGVELFLEAITRFFPSSLRLSSIEYRLDVVRNGKPTAIMKAIVSVSGDRNDAKVTMEADARSDWKQFLGPMTETEKRRTAHRH